MVLARMLLTRIFCDARAGRPDETERFYDVSCRSSGFFRRSKTLGLTILTSSTSLRCPFATTLHDQQNDHFRGSFYDIVLGTEWREPLLKFRTNRRTVVEHHSMSITHANHANDFQGAV